VKGVCVWLVFWKGQLWRLDQMGGSRGTTQNIVVEWINKWISDICISTTYYEWLASEYKKWIKVVGDQ
jgi:hypothetical protein